MSKQKVELTSDTDTDAILEKVKEIYKITYTSFESKLNCKQIPLSFTAKY